MADRPEPFAFAQKDEFFALPPEEQPPHIWECLQYLEHMHEAGEALDTPEQHRYRARFRDDDVPFGN